MALTTSGCAPSDASGDGRCIAALSLKEKNIQDLPGEICWRADSVHTTHATKAAVRLRCSSFVTARAMTSLCRALSAAVFAHITNAALPCLNKTVLIVSPS